MSIERYAIVTGANTGIGYETTKALVSAGYHVILACRDSTKTNNAIQKMAKEVAKKNPELDEQQLLSRLEYRHLDLSKLSSVTSFAHQFNQTRRPLHILICNAGCSSAPRSADGFEGVFQTNYLAHFYLTNLLTESLRAAGGSRVINVSSAMHHMGDSDILTYAHKVAARSYPCSKLYQVYAGNEYHRRHFESDGIAVFNVSPGAVATDIWRNDPWLVQLIVQKVFLTPVQGAATTIYAALHLQPHTVHDNNAFAAPYISPYKTHPVIPYAASEAWQPSFFAIPNESRARAITYDKDLCKSIFDKTEQLISSAIGEQRAT